MLKITRHHIIEEQLKQHGSILISSLSKQAFCSEETIRRDLKEMEADGKLVRIHGGAFLPEKFDKSVPVQLREEIYKEEKVKIAKRALKLINDNDVIFLDSSSTCLTLCEEILKTNLSITIITNSILICSAASGGYSQVRVICLGGEFYKKNFSFIGYQTTQDIGFYMADKCFISCPSVDLKFGMQDNHIASAKIREQMIEHSRQAFLIADHTKFSSSSDIIFSDMKKLSAIITNAELSVDWYNKLLNMDIKIFYC